MPVPVIPVDPELPTTLAEPAPDTAWTEPADAAAELERQIRVYVGLGFPALLGTDEAGLRAAVEPLRAVVADVDLAALQAAAVPGRADDHVPFVLVLGGDLAPNHVVPAMRRGTRRGVSVIDDADMATYRALEDVTPPSGPYLLWSVDTGSEFCGVRPEDALRTVRDRGRTPLTIAEGLALVVTRPDMLRPNRCFSLMGSRAGNQRVPAIWISERRPKLGWCWDRNPHTWLGAASAAGRRGPDGPHLSNQSVPVAAGR